METGDSLEVLEELLRQADVLLATTYELRVAVDSQERAVDALRQWLLVAHELVLRDRLNERVN